MWCYINFFFHAEKGYSRLGFFCCSTFPTFDSFGRKKYSDHFFFFSFSEQSHCVFYFIHRVSLKSLSIFSCIDNTYPVFPAKRKVVETFQAHPNTTNSRSCFSPLKRKLFQNNTFLSLPPSLF